MAEINWGAVGAWALALLTGGGLSEARNYFANRRKERAEALAIEKGAVRTDAETDRVNVDTDLTVGEAWKGYAEEMKAARQSADAARQAADIRAAEFDKRAAEFERRASEFEARAIGFEQRALTFERRAGELEGLVANLRGQIDALLKTNGDLLREVTGLRQENAERVAAREVAENRLRALETAPRPVPVVNVEVKP